MRATRFWSNLTTAAVIFAMVGVLNQNAVLPAVAVREYIKFALTTDFDYTALAAKARVLGTFSQRVKWSELVEAIAPRLLVGR